VHAIRFYDCVSHGSCVLFASLAVFCLADLARAQPVQVARLPLADSPTANLTSEEQEAWHARARLPGANPSWPPPWLKGMKAHVARLNATGDLPPDGLLKSPDAARRFVALFYLDWRDGHANSHWQGVLLNSAGFLKVEDDETADALAEGLLQVYSEGGGLASPAHEMLLAGALSRIDAASFPELPIVADDLLAEAELWATSNRQAHTLEEIAFERKRIASDVALAATIVAASREPEVAPPAVGDRDELFAKRMVAEPVAAAPPARAPAAAPTVPASEDLAERILRVGRARPFDLAQWNEVFDDARRFACAGRDPDTRAILRQLRAATVIMKRDLTDKQAAGRPVAQWLRALRDQARITPTASFQRSWSRCASTLDASLQTSLQAGSGADAMFDSRQPATASQPAATWRTKR
jgi:hypothetical protein